MTVQIIRGNALHLPLADETVDLVCTSPPYFGLRSYQDGGAHYAGQLGSEATPAEFVDALIAATREMVRVLKPSGSIWVNLGDKYDSGTTTARTNPGTIKDGTGQGYHLGSPRVSLGRPKSLLGIPWRYAIACIDQLGLILRAEVIWNKPNGLPESVTDRVRRSHESWFHLVKQPRYYSAVDEIREEQVAPVYGVKGRAGAGKHLRMGTGRIDQDDDREFSSNPLGKLPGSVWTIPTEPLTIPPELGVDHFAAYPTELPRRIIQGWTPPGICEACGEGRRPVADRTLDIKHVQVNAYREGDATGHPRWNVPVGAGRVVGSTTSTITGYVCDCTPHTDHPERRGTDWRAGGDRGNGARPLTAERPTQPRATELGPVREYHFGQWTPAPTRPALVLDPFGGTGTTALVADVLGRHAIHIDLSNDYNRLARWRIHDPASRAKAARVDKPPPVIDGQLTLGEL